MADANRSQVSHTISRPRNLTQQETYQTISHWFSGVKAFFRRDPTFATFVDEETRWTPGAANYGFAAETEGEKRTAARLKQDCVMFLEAICTYLPFGFARDQICLETKSIGSVLDIILECYNAQLTQDSFMELALMKLEPSEPPYQFYLRMCDHMRKHLPKRDVEVKNIRVTVDQEPIVTGSSQTELNSEYLI